MVAKYKALKLPSLSLCTIAIFGKSFWKTVFGKSFLENSFGQKNVFWPNRFRSICLLQALPCAGKALCRLSFMQVSALCRRTSQQLQSAVSGDISLANFLTNGRLGTFGQAVHFHNWWTQCSSEMNNLIITPALVRIFQQSPCFCCLRSPPRQFLQQLVYNKRRFSGAMHIHACIPIKRVELHR